MDEFFLEKGIKKARQKGGQKHFKVSLMLFLFLGVYDQIVISGRCCVSVSFSA